MSEIFGLTFQGIESNDMPVEGILLIKALDEDGDVQTILRATEGLSKAEALGMLISAGDQIRTYISEDWREEEE